MTDLKEAMDKEFWGKAMDIYKRLGERRIFINGDVRDIIYNKLKDQEEKDKKEMTYEEFKGQYQNNKKWKFDQFKIVCQKCGSSKVEFNSNMALERGYYDDYEVEGRIIVKCHGCGNAFELNFWDIEK
jgi:hypothetical protein